PGLLTHCVWLLFSNVGDLRESFVEVIQLTFVVIGVPFARRETRQRFGIDLPWDSVQSPAREPAVFVHRAVSQNLEILLRVPGGCLGIIEREGETHALHWHLLDAIDLFWLRQAGRFEDGRSNIRAMSELTAQTALVRNAFRPT